MGLTEKKEGGCVQKEPKRMNADEMRQLEYLLVMERELRIRPEVLRERLKDIPNGWRQLRLISRVVGDLGKSLTKTLDRKGIHHLRQVSSNGQILVQVRPAIKAPEQILVWEDDLRVMINWTMEANCAICLKAPAEIRGCKLRKALDHIAPTRGDAPSGHCPYRDVAETHKLGEYV